MEKNLPEMKPTVSSITDSNWLGKTVGCEVTSKVANNSSLGSNFSVPEKKK